MAVSALEIVSRSPVAEGRSFGDVGPYEQLEGTVRFAVDPGHPRNGMIVDLEHAPRDSAGMVNCSAGFRILRPANPQRGSHRLLFDVVNRGRPVSLRFFNRGGSADDFSSPWDTGDGFLMRRGFTLVMCGWQHDVPVSGGLLRIEIPEAVTPDGPLSGRISVPFQPNWPIQVKDLTDYNHVPYPTNNLDDPNAVLTVRDDEDAVRQVIPREQWSFARLEEGRVVPDPYHVHMASGFEPGKVYEVIYSVTGAPVVGLGLVAVRDMASFVRFGEAGQGNPCAGDIEHAYCFGVSQTGRYLRQFLYLGINEDEEERTVFDGIIAHVGGHRRGEFNQRFGRPVRTMTVGKESMGTMFPFTDVEQTDPETEITDGLLSKLKARGKLPKVYFTNTSAEYFRGDASLIHTDVGGKRDVAHSDSVRVYHFAGTQHGIGIFPLTDTSPADGSRGQQPFNMVDYSPLLRAALVNLDRWVTSNEPAPPSLHPRIDDGTAVPRDRTADAFRDIPGVNFPGHLRYLSRLDFGPGTEAGLATDLPPAIGKPYGAVTSAVDADGNEIAGTRLPEISVPLGTHTGWNLRHPDMGAPEQTMGMIGSSIPFPATKAEREASGDPRLSIEERYSSKDDYLRQVREAAEALVAEGYLLEEDLATVIRQASDRYDTLRYPVRETKPADD